MYVKDIFFLYMGNWESTIKVCKYKQVAMRKHLGNLT